MEQNITELTKIWEEWINPKYCDLAYIVKLRQWYKNQDNETLLLEDFLNQDRAQAIANCLRKINLYKPSYSLHWGNKNLEYKEVSKDVFYSAKEFERFGTHQIIPNLDDIFSSNVGLSEQEQHEMEKYFNFIVIGPVFRSWISVVISEQVSSKVSCEIVKYKENDFLAPHCDTHDDRLIGINFYLDPNWKDKNGGVLGFKSEKEKLKICKPYYNSISLIPIRDSYQHWVSSWKSKKTGRYTVSMSFRPN